MFDYRRMSLSAEMEQEILRRSKYFKMQSSSNLKAIDHSRSSEEEEEDQPEDLPQ